MPVVNFNRNVELNDGIDRWNADSIGVVDAVLLSDALILMHQTGYNQSISLNSIAGKELIKSIVPDNGICINHGK